MSVIASLIRQMASAGATPEVIAMAVEALETATEARRSVDRERKRRQRDRETVTSRDFTGSHVTDRDNPLLPSSEKSGSLPDPLSETQPSPHNPVPPIVPPPHSAFEQFWEAWPHKVSKGQARPAFEKAVRKIGTSDPLAVILAGVQRTVMSQKWQEGFRPNPATWLNGERWCDLPDVSVVVPMVRSTGPPAESFAEREERLTREAFDRLMARKDQASA